MMQTWQNSVQTFVPRAQNKIWGNTGKLSPKRLEEMQEAKNYLDEETLTTILNPLKIADAYYEKFPGVDPYPVRQSPWTETQIAWGKFHSKKATDTQPARRLFNSLKDPHFYSLHAADIGLDPYYENAANFPLFSYDPDLRKIWCAKLKEIFGKNYFYKLEHSTRMHVHVIAEGGALPHIPRGGELVKPIKAGDEIKVLGYLYKPHGTHTKENLAMWIYARRKLWLQGKNLPPTCGYVGLQSVEDFNRSVLTKATPTNTTNTSIIVINNKKNKGRYEDDLEDDVYQLPEIIDISKIDRTKYRDYG